MVQLVVVHADVVVQVTANTNICTTKTIHDDDDDDDDDDDICVVDCIGRRIVYNFELVVEDICKSKSS